MRSFRFGGIVVAVAALLSTVLTGGASATPYHHHHHPSSVLYLTVAAHGTSSTVRLRCHPEGGSHPSPWRACRAVTRARGDFDRLPGRRGMACTLDYRPVVASVRGMWHGARLHWRHRFGNACAMHVRTGAVFDF